MISPEVLYAPPKTYPRRTLIERIYRDETGYKMPRVIKRILLRKPTPKRKSR